MITNYGHLTYCTNIHSGESWADHFVSLKRNVPGIKAQVCPAQSFGIGLRLSNEASLELVKQDVLIEFQVWLQQEGLLCVYHEWISVWRFPSYYCKR